MKYKEITIEHFLHVYETMYKKQLSTSEKKKIIKYAIKSPKSLIGLSTKELLLVREIRQLQLEILDVSNCDQLRIIV